MGSVENLSDEDAREIINAIVERSVKPDYMVKQRKTLRQILHYYTYETKVILSHYFGAKYIIPSFTNKMRRDKMMKKLRAEWDVIASAKIIPSDGKFVIMYPMQMQPEANLDVWGNKYMNQLNSIKGILNNTDNDCVILLKPNPKAKYELTRDLLDYIKANDRIITVPLSYPMQECLKKTNLVVAVTGTIAIECILMNKPIVTLHKTINNEMDNCPFMQDMCELSKYVDFVRNRSFPEISEESKIEFLNMLNKSSYYGYPYVSDFDNNLSEAEGCSSDIIKLVNSL